MGTNEKELIGYVHSVETAGMVDGPGIRYLVFLAGCNLRCKYCHNPDTWKMKDGYQASVGEILQDIEKYRSYLTFSGGGVTVTGGEPLMQAEFLRELLKACKRAGFHTTVDTSGFANTKVIREVLQYTDLLLLDLKGIDPARYEALTAVPLAPTLATFQIAEEMQVPVWVRYVLVPGLTDLEEDLRAARQFLDGFTNIERTDVLPFHKMGEYKWAELGLSYTLAETESPTAEELAIAREILIKKPAKE